MKKLFLCSLLLITLGVCAKPYDHSLGISGGMFNGFSYKTLVREHLAVQTDLGVHLTIFKGRSMSFQANPMLMYQTPFYSNSVCDINFFAGGGVSLGFLAYYDEYYKKYYYEYVLRYKFGVNSMTGIEFAFTKAPLALSFDFRPGYGMSGNYSDLWHDFE